LRLPGSGCRLRKRMVRTLIEWAVSKVKFRRMALLGLVCVSAAAWSLVSGLMVSQQLRAQSAQAIAGSLPSFEVASVRPASPSKGGFIVGFFTYPGGRIVAKACTLQYLIMLAFDVQRFQISGDQGWIDNARFDIQAEPPDSSQSSKSNPASPRSPPSDEQRQMLQSLLIDRFQLQFHREAREGSVYILAKGGKALKLQAPKEKSAFPWAGGIGGGLPGGSGLRGENISMPQLAERLSQWLERPVLDRTGLSGSFDFEYKSGDEDTYASSTDVESSVINSLKGIGLKLKAAKGPVATIFIDHAQQPSPN